MLGTVIIKNMFGFSLPWIIAHLIGDYIFQNDWMAIGKKKSYFICSVHIATYMLPFLFTTLNPIQLVLIAIQHYIQDRYEFIKWFCAITGKFKAEVGITLPWGHFIVDNVFHIVWVWWVVVYCA